MKFFNGNIPISNLNDFAEYYISKPNNKELAHFVAHSYQFLKLSDTFSEEISNSLDEISNEIESILDNYIYELDIENLKFENAFFFAGNMLGKIYEEHNSFYALILKHFKDDYDIHRIGYLTDVVFFRQLGKYAFTKNNFKVAAYYNSWALTYLWAGWTPYNNFSPVEKKYLRMKALVIPLIKRIWELDSEHLLFGIQVARIVVELFPNEKFTEAQIKELIKSNELTPRKIVKRDENNDYGNTMQERKARKKLIENIKQELSSYCDELLLMTP